MVIIIASMVRSRALPIQLGGVVVGWDDDGDSNDDEDSGGISSGDGLVVKALTALQVL